MSNLYLTVVYYSLQVTSTLSMETLTIPSNLLSNPSSDCPEIVLGTVITELRNHWSLWCGQPVGTLICAADLLVVVAHTGTTLLFHLGLSVCAENDGKHSNRLYGTCLLACMCMMCLHASMKAAVALWKLAHTWKIWDKQWLPGRVKPLAATSISPKFTCTPATRHTSPTWNRRSTETFQ